MKNFSKFSIVVLVVLFLFSCDGKNKNPGGDTPPVTGVPAIIDGKSPLLMVNQKFGIKEVLRIETSDRYSNDTMLYVFNENQQLTTMKYDRFKEELIWQNNQLKRIEYYEFENNVWQKESYEVVFSYNGEGKITSIIGMEDDGDYVKFSYTYTNSTTIEEIFETNNAERGYDHKKTNPFIKSMANRMERQNKKSGTLRTIKSTMTINNNRITKIVMSELKNGVWENRPDYFTFDWENQNLVKVNTLGVDYSSTVTSIFDNNNSVERLISYPIFVTDGLDEIMKLSKNNSTSRNQDGKIRTSTYEYNTQKFPTKETESDDNEVITYRYKF